MTVNGTSFIQSGKIFTFNDNSARQNHPKLPVGNYIIQIDERSGELYLEQVESFPKSGKLYGKVRSQTGRILNTFFERPSGTGVLLVGEKGSGKTLLAKNISIEAAKQGVPTLIVNTPFVGDKFNKFIQNISQPAIIFFDEFEKVYDEERQELVLTLFDGSFPSKKLFLITSNDEDLINCNMFNRPGRIYYMLEFGGSKPGLC